MGDKPRYETSVSPSNALDGWTDVTIRDNKLGVDVKGSSAHNDPHEAREVAEDRAWEKYRGEYGPPPSQR